MSRRHLPALIALSGVSLALTAPVCAAEATLSTLAGTRACLMRLPNAVAGLPPARPPVPSVLFVFALAHDDVSTGGGVGTRPHAHKQLGVWYGGGSYHGIILSFFRSVRDARASSRSLASPNGGKLIGNVVVTWDQRAAPSRSARDTIFGCLRSDAAGGVPTRTLPPATVATFAGGWGGHTRSLSITSSGDGREDADDGCCTRVYRMTFEIISVSGTLTRAAAVYRVTSFRRYESGVRPVGVGDVGELLLRNGIVTNTLTRDFFCSEPAWSATGACGA